MIKLTDERIAELIAEPKPLPSGFREVLLQKMKVKDSHKRSELRVEGKQGSIFYIKIRQNTINLLNFSIILVYEFKEKPKTSGERTDLFRLRRYNGKSHMHTNQLERDHFRDFHIHYATERYQQASYHEDAYAEATDSFGSLGDALQCLIMECNFELPSDEPRKLL